MYKKVWFLCVKVADPNFYYKEEKMKVTEIAKKIWDDELFIAFMELRFPNEQSEEYVREWKSRFMTGNPIPYMDEETKKAYLKAIEEYITNIKK